MAVAAHSRSRSWVWVGIVTVSSLIILGVLQPQLLLEANTPSGGDMGAHVYGPAYLRDVLLPNGRLMGWSQDWFAGFPVFYFYFPLPSLAIVLLDLFLPYGTAFKLVTVMGLVGLPPAVAFMTRSFGFSRAIAAVTAAGAVVFVFLESYSIYGGNVASSLAGEFSYSWSFTLGMVYLGYLMRVVDGERTAIPRAAVFFALTALSHVLTTLVLVLASLPLLLRKRLDRPAAITVWSWAFALAGFWALPLLMRISQSSDMAWTPLSRWEEVFPIELWLLIPVAVCGAVWAIRRTHRVVPLITAALVPVVYYPLPLVLPDLLPELFGDGRFKLWNGRLLPYWYFGIVFFAALGLAAGVLHASRRLPDRLSAWWLRAFIIVGTGVGIWVVVDSDLPAYAWIAVAVTGGAALVASAFATFPVSSRALLTGFAGAVLALGALAGVSFIDGWARWNYSGYEGKDVYPEYAALMETVDALPPGRILWEANSGMNSYGTPMALMLFPYWTEGSHGSMEGLYFESSLTTPFHFITAGEMSSKPSNPIPGLPYSNFDFERGIAHLRHFAVDYYVTYTEEAREKADEDPDLERLAVSEPFAVYRVPDSPLVEAARFQPAVYDPSLAFEGSGPDYEEVILDWFSEPDLLDRWLALEGPEEWPRVGPTIGSALELSPPLPGGNVSDIVVDDHSVSFKTDAVGVPHLVKVSYFPNWVAEGAEGPWHAAPSLMVVVPTQEQVTLEFRNQSAEWVGWILTILGLGALVLRRRFGLTDRSASAEKSPHRPKAPKRARHAAQK
ncbi:MAG: hypothetical protein R3246_04090 [Acidimicrobiia bacterium]|nr:hypothetical protein [Acidimicrobiia bacterium]